MTDHHLPVFELGPADQPTAIECHRRRGDGRLVVQIREGARASTRLVDGINDLLADTTIRAAMKRALRRYVRRST